MYMCYLDESGVQENTGTRYFVLSGLAIPAEQWKPCEQQLLQCKKPYDLEDVEVHAAWMARRYVEQEQIPNFAGLTRQERRKAARGKRDEALIKLAARGTARGLKEAKKNYRKTDPYIHLTIDERRQLLLNLADIISSWQYARLSPK
ncbi:MAG: DUF3800 domain-containing protein [Gemmataceae bacterium]|nr:DUF3800 domain-containing protein [Gemmataceae bacterium]MCI0739141.1 DUF3800 domain-containing protein [Gemmataceae bacterium]